MKTPSTNSYYTLRRLVLPAPEKQLKCILFFSLLILFSCQEFVEVGPPPNQIVSSSGFSDDATAMASIRGVYSEMNNGTTIGNFAVAFYGGQSADEFRNYSSAQSRLDISENNIHPENELVATFWNDGYRFIYYTNAILESLSRSPDVTTETKNQLEGEARFLRAYCHFYLVNLFGDVPYIKTTDYRINRFASRNTAASVYENIITDLKAAEDLLSENYVAPDRIRPNKMVVKAFLARVYLYSREWATAESYASAVISDAAYQLEELNSVFLKGSREVIWQLMPIRSPINSTAAGSYIITFLPNVDFTPELLNSFETGDGRKDAWVHTLNSPFGTFNFPYKYKVRLSVDIVECDVIFRLAEQFLIRAEARAEQGKIPEAITDIDVIRQRAELPTIASVDPGISQEQLLLAIEQERRIELMSEGHRWLDLKRTGRADEVLAPLKPEWQATDVLYPIPQRDMNSNPNLNQNSGY